MIWVFWSLTIGYLVAVGVAEAWSRLPVGHHHDWRCVWHLGDVWTECQVCGERRQIPPDDLADMPPGYPIGQAFRHPRPHDEWMNT